MAEMRAQDLLDDEFMAKIEQLRIVSRKVIVGRIRGERITRKRGQSMEFADYRRYSAGDDIRFVDWNLYARLDKLFLKLFLEEEDLHVYILLDTSKSMGYGDPAKLDCARKVAAAIAYIGLCNYDRVVIGAFGQDRLETLGPLRGRRQVLRLLEFLASKRGSGDTELATVFRRFAVAHRRPGVLLVISDFMDKSGYEDALRYFIAANQDVFILHMLAKEEMEPQLTGDLKLVDIEDQDETEITISAPLMKAYQRTLQNFVGGLKQYAGRRGMNYLLASTSMSFDTLVLDYLRRRGLVT